MGKNKNYKQQIALEWWRGMSIEAKHDYVKSWQKSLPDNKTYSSAKDWSFELIDGSSSHIERVYDFITHTN